MKNALIKSSHQPNQNDTHTDTHKYLWEVFHNQNINAKEEHHMVYTNYIVNRVQYECEKY